MEVFVPMPGGDVVPIEHLPVTAAKETLGVFICPNGCAKEQFRAMKAKGHKKWVDRARDLFLKCRTGQEN